VITGNVKVALARLKPSFWTTCSLASISRSYDLDCLSSSVRHQRRWLSLGKGSQIRSADRCWQCAWLFSSAGNAPYEDEVNVCQSFSEWTPKENYEASNFRTIWVDRKLWHVFLALNLFGIWKTDENWWSCGPLCSKEWSPDAELMVVLENGILKQMTFEQSESTLSTWTLCRPARRQVPLTRTLSAVPAVRCHLLSSASATWYQVQVLVALPLV
jgi:hypothetical protein